MSHDDFADRREAEEEEKRIAGTKLLGPTPEVQILGPDSARASVNTIPIEDLRKTFRHGRNAATAHRRRSGSSPQALATCLSISILEIWVLGLMLSLLAV